MSRFLPASSPTRAVAACGAVAAVALLAAVGSAARASGTPERLAASGRPVELRGVWLTNVDSRVLDSRAAIAEAMAFLAGHHLNIVFPVVWNKAATTYPSRILREAIGVEIDPRYRGRDPLAEVVEEAHRRRIAVVPWFEFGFAASYKADGGPLIASHPAWAARDRDGRLLAKNGFEWMDPFNEDVERLLASLVAEVVERYDVDGVQGDDRFPALPVEGSYSEAARAAYAPDHAGAGPPLDPRDAGWVRWRAGRLSGIAERIYRDVKRRKPYAVVSWAPSIFPFSLEEYLQDWPAWVRDGYADLVHPQVYRRDIDAYGQALDAQGAAVPPGRRSTIFPGVLINVGSYVVSEALLLDMVAANRGRGYRGEVFFFYEGLRKNNDALAKALVKSYYAGPADLPFPVRF